MFYALCVAMVTFQSASQYLTLIDQSCCENYNSENFGESVYVATLSFV